MSFGRRRWPGPRGAPPAPGGVAPDPGPRHRATGASGPLPPAVGAVFLRRRAVEGDEAAFATAPPLSTGRGTRGGPGERPPTGRAGPRAAQRGGTRGGRGAAGCQKHPRTRLRAKNDDLSVRRGRRTRSRVGVGQKRARTARIGRAHRVFWWYKRSSLLRVVQRVAGRRAAAGDGRGRGRSRRRRRGGPGAPSLCVAAVRRRGLPLPGGWAVARSGTDTQSVGEPYRARESERQAWYRAARLRRRASYDPFRPSGGP